MGAATWDRALVARDPPSSTDNVHPTPVTDLSITWTLIAISSVVLLVAIYLLYTCLCLRSKARRNFKRPTPLNLMKPLSRCNTHNQVSIPLETLVRRPRMPSRPTETHHPRPARVPTLDDPITPHAMDNVPPIIPKWPLPPFSPFSIGPFTPGIFASQSFVPQLDSPPTTAYSIHSPFDMPRNTPSVLESALPSSQIRSPFSFVRSETMDSQFTSRSQPQRNPSNNNEVMTPISPVTTPGTAQSPGTSTSQDDSFTRQQANDTLQLRPWFERVDANALTRQRGRPLPAIPNRRLGFSFPVTHGRASPSLYTTLYGTHSASTSMCSAPPPPYAPLDATMQLLSLPPTARLAPEPANDAIRSIPGKAVYNFPRRYQTQPLSIISEASPVSISRNDASGSSDRSPSVLYAHNRSKSVPLKNPSLRGVSLWDGAGVDIEASRYLHPRNSKSAKGLQDPSHKIDKIKSTRAVPGLFKIDV